MLFLLLLLWCWTILSELGRILVSLSSESGDINHDCHILVCDYLLHKYFHWYIQRTQLSQQNNQMDVDRFVYRKQVAALVTMAMDTRNQ